MLEEILHAKSITPAGCGGVWEATAKAIRVQQIAGQAASRWDGLGVGSPHRTYLELLRPKIRCSRTMKFSGINQFWSVRGLPSSLGAGRSPSSNFCDHLVGQLPWPTIQASTHFARLQRLQKRNQPTLMFGRYTEPKRMARHGTLFDSKPLESGRYVVGPKACRVEPVFQCRDRAVRSMPSLRKAMEGTSW
jgi:hypothetical protein